MNNIESINTVSVEGNEHRNGNQAYICDLCEVPS